MGIIEGSISYLAIVVNRLSENRRLLKKHYQTNLKRHNNP
jgi:hypothetical protein